MNNFFLSIFLLINFFLTSGALAFSYRVEDGFDQFSYFGDGIHNVDNSNGIGDFSSLNLSCDFGEQKTIYKDFNKLRKGKYKVSFYLKTEDIQKDKYNYSLWNFYKTSGDEKTVFYDITGTENWKKVEYSVDVEDRFQFWLRLKAPGKIWFDRFSIEKIDSNIDLNFEDASSLGKSIPSLKTVMSKKKLKDQALIKKEYTFSKGKYLNFYKKDLLTSNFSSFDIIHFDLLNKSNARPIIYLVLKDNKSTNYWTQLNFKSHLNKGLNRLSFDLTQFLGERGSSKYRRGLDLSKISHLYLVVDPDNKTKLSGNFTLKNMKISQNSELFKPKDHLFFDFTSHKAKKSAYFQTITSQDLYSNNRGYGFITPEFYRIYDSIHVPDPYRYSIGLLKGKLRVDLPNGKYNIKLNLNSLGYWDVPFWKKRNVLVNGKNFVNESRENASSFIKDLLRFENIEPQKGDNPFDLYLKKIFTPLEMNVTVKNKKLLFEFEGDPSGINLNTLSICPISKLKECTSYLTDLNDFYSDHYSVISRSASTYTYDTPKELNFEFIQDNLYLLPESKASVDLSKTFIGIKSSVFTKLIRLQNTNSEHKVKIKLLGFTPSQYSIKKIMNQFSSEDMNHETYTLTGKIIAPLEENLILNAGETRYLLLEIFNNKIDQNFLYKLSLELDDFKTKKKIKFSYKSLDIDLPKIDFPVGFLGLCPLNSPYFVNSKFDDFKHSLCKKVLKDLANRGFTTFSGLPRLEDKNHFNEILSLANSLGIKEVYTYGGLFPSKDLLQKPDQLKKILKISSEPKLVYTFSDEAQGYSNLIESDIKKAITLKNSIPILPLGGFSDLNDPRTKELISYFDIGFYSNITKVGIDAIIKKGKRWGLYNGSVDSFKSPEFAFGLGLYMARKAGLSAYLDWHASAFQNYPYFELDGREVDSVMYYPRSNGDILPNIKLEFATNGLNIYKSLIFLDSKLAKQSSPLANSYKKWLSKHINEHDLFSTQAFYVSNRYDSVKFKQELYHFLESSTK